MTLNPPSQYADDRNFRARQRLWAHQDPAFDIVEWVLDLAGVAAGHDVLDAGCGNGSYLRAMDTRGVSAVGLDLSLGMLAAASPHGRLVNGDVVTLAFRDAAFDVVLAPHMLYHVPDRRAAAHELRRVVRSTGACVVVTNGADHMRSLRDLVEASAREASPGWEMRNPSTHAFSLENAAAQLGVAFESVRCVRPTGVPPVVIRDPDIAADYVASVGDHYQHEVARPWAEVVTDVRRAVERAIEKDGAFQVRGSVGAFVCR